MLTESRIVMPLVGNGMNYVNSKECHDAFSKMLIDYYGGYTVTYGVGGWAGPKGVRVLEDVAIYDVAFDLDHVDFDRDHVNDAEHFEHLALWLGGQLHQESVYFRLEFEVRYLPVLQARAGSNLFEVV